MDHKAIILDVQKRDEEIFRVITGGMSLDEWINILFKTARTNYFDALRMEMAEHSKENGNYTIPLNPEMMYDLARNIGLVPELNGSLQYPMPPVPDGYNILQPESK